MRYAGGDRAFAEDLVHDVFVKLLEHQGSLDDDVGGWLYRVTANLAISKVRHRSVVARLRESVSAIPLIGRVIGPREATELRQQLEHVEQVLAVLPELERTVLAMRLLDDLTQQEIAATLSLSKGYVSKLMARAEARVRSAGWSLDPDEP